MTDDGLQTCGVPYDEILDQVTDHRPPRDPEHQATCATCRATLAEVLDAWGAVSDLVDQRVLAPADLLRTVMDRVRQLLREPWYAVLHTPDGDIKIAARVVGAIARLAAEDVPRVSLALSGGRTGSTHSLNDLAGTTGESATDIGVSGTHVVIDVDVVVEIGSRIPDLADQIRARIRRDVSGYTGLSIAEVNVTVVDVEAPG